jgi:uncharacterized membrane protein
VDNSSKRKKFDALVSRILFFELGVLFIIVTALVILNNSVTEISAITVSVIFLIIGLFCMYSCFTIDDKKVIRWAEKTGSHWLLFFLVLVAYGMADVIRGKR